MDSTDLVSENYKARLIAEVAVDVFEGPARGLRIPGHDCQQ